MKILIIFNPNAGKGKGKLYAQRLQRELEKLGINTAEIFCSVSIDAMREFHKNNTANIKGYSLIVIIGGDGTIGPNVDAMLKNNIYVPIYALGKGTANDFASYFRTHVRIKKAAKIIASGRIMQIDTIKVEMENNQLGVNYAVSDAAGGAFTNGVTKYNEKSKRMFGKLAYLVKAAWQALWIKNQRVRFTVDGSSFEQSVFLFYILNTKNVGGLKGAGSLAQPDDGLLDLVCLKQSRLWGKLCIVFSVLFNRMHKCKHAVYRQGKSFKIEVIGEPIHNFTKTDTDGNTGGDYPLFVTVGPQITVVTNRKTKEIRKSVDRQ